MGATKILYGLFFLKALDIREETIHEPLNEFDDLGGLLDEGVQPYLHRGIDGFDSFLVNYLLQE